MSTTVTYKGQTLTTVENQTKTLNTAGTWVEGDFTLTDVTQGGGGEWTTEGIANRTEPNGNIVLGNGVTAVSDYAFYKCTGITSASGMTSIGQHAFDGCTSLASVNIDTVTGVIDQFAFGGCTSLKKISSNSNAIVRSFFIANSGVTEVSLPYSASVGNNSVAGGTCRNSPHLVKAFFSRAAMNGGASWQNGAADLFTNCPLLEIADIGWIAANQWNTTMFRDCPNLRTIISRGTSKVPTLSAWSANAMGGIYNNPTESTIYVPQALISSYQTATNWSTAYAAGVTFAPIEGSEYEL